ncbi:Dihydrolipoyllysine-residue acetyltransferase component of pyruvate dehydrogenase complex isoform 3 [Schistosoma japonicum]|uniref:Acetyltransferase component of pyruvate dehydrogenase complex n=1 Tax=Schistosoma japonicum TaxID=6182 RepID=A0A4Z2CPD3_SCHJA|nr:Dihydrolipoyllysine-residue acetyltransferase component of pyruvate dehydrogenase complex isoform 3 [Schistosoma japonicum]
MAFRAGKPLMGLRGFCRPCACFLSGKRQIMPTTIDRSLTCRRSVILVNHDWLFLSFKRFLCKFLVEYCYDLAYPTHLVVKLPNLSPTMETGTVVSWAKNEGDEVSEGDLLAEIETDKATMSFDASESGYLAKILAPAGSKDIPVGTALCIIVQDENAVPAFKDYVVESTEKVATPKAKEVSKPQTVSSATAPSPKPTPVTPTPTSKTPTCGERIVASPYARCLAAEKGLDLSQVVGTGIDGMIRSVDLSAAPTSLKATTMTTSPIPVSGKFEDISVSNMRSVIAKRLIQSKQTIPHYYLTMDIQLDEILEIRSKINANLSSLVDAKSDEPVLKISLNDILIKAASLACLKVPECNSSWQGDFIRRYHNVDISVAVAVPAGLITPIIFSADTKGLVQINKEMRMLVAKAKQNKLQPQEYQGGTFSISNLGMFGISNFSAVINPPQSCILAVGSSRQKILPDKNNPAGFKKANILSVTLSCDHRVVDGAVGATWLGEFKNILENPALMLI